MEVRQLNRGQLDALKQAYIFETCPAPSWGDLAAAAEVTDAEIFECYSGVDFVPEDFE